MVKKSLKHIIAVLLVAVVVIGLFAGCGGKDDGKLTVRVWSSDGGTREFMIDKVEEFNKAHDDIKIEYQVIASGLDDMTKNAFENNNGPEIFSGSVNTMLQYDKLGYCIPIEALEGGKEYVENLRVEVPNQDKYIFDGKIYRYPVASVTGGLIYNTELFKQAGIVDENGEAKPPVTWEELVEDCRKIKALGNGKYGIGLPFKDVGWSYALGWGASASQNALIEYDFDNQEVKFHSKKMLEYVLQIKNDNSSYPGSESLDNDTLRLQFAEGNIGMFFGASWDVGVLTDQFPAKCDWEVAPYPTYNENGDFYLQDGQASSTLSIGNSATKTPEMSRAVMEVYSWLYSDELITQKFESMLEIPYDLEAIQGIDRSKFSKQWLQFCDMQEITIEPKVAVSLKLVGDNNRAVYDRVYAGKISIDGAIKELNERYTSAFKQGIAEGSIDPSKYEKKNNKRGE